MFQNYFKIGWRNLLKNKGTSFINIGGLTVGMAVAMLIGLWVLDELSFNKYHENYPYIAQVMRKGKDYTNSIEPTGLGTLLKTKYGNHFKHVVLVRAGLRSVRSLQMTRPFCRRVISCSRKARKCLA